MSLSLRLWCWVVVWVGLGVVCEEAYAIDRDFERVPPEQDMAWIGGGEFRFGRGSAVQSIAVRGFWIDRYEVTVGEYEVCVGRGVCRPLMGGVLKVGADIAAFGMQWSDARAYCAMVGKRLPTEKEWERAARGREGFLYARDNVLRFGDANILWGMRERGKAGGVVKPPGSFPRDVSPEGVYDMVGNVAEFIDVGVGVWSTAYQYSKGGSVTTTLSGAVLWQKRSHRVHNGASDIVGFRCVRDAF